MAYTCIIIPIQLGSISSPMYTANNQGELVTAHLAWVNVPTRKRFVLLYGCLFLPLYGPIEPEFFSFFLGEETQNLYISTKWAPTWRIIPLSKWLITMVSKSPK